MSLRRTFSHARYYYLLYVMATILVLVLVWLGLRDSYAYRTLAVGDYNSYRCDMQGGSGASDTLRILDAIYVEDMNLVGNWCQSGRLAQLVDSLEIRTVHRDQFDLRELFEAHYDLLLAKPELVSGTGPEAHSSKS